jgi:hypothetical protein
MTTRGSRNNAVHEKLVWILYEYEVDEVGVAPLRHGSGNNNSIEKLQETQLVYRWLMQVESRATCSLDEFVMGSYFSPKP